MSFHRPADRPGFLTLVTPGSMELSRWVEHEAEQKFKLVHDLETLELLLHSPLVQAAGDVARVIIDGATDLDGFLRLSTSLPNAFLGEVLYIRRDGAGYLSTRELKTLRTVKNLSPAEVEVYLRWHGLPAMPRGSYPVEPRPGLRPQLKKSER